MTVSVVIVSYNVRDLLARCIGSLAEADEVVVVDNASHDQSADMVRAEFPDVRLIASKRNLGFSAGVNAGAAQSSSDLILLLNPDAVLPDGTLGQMKARLQARPRAWAMGFRQADSRGFFQLALGPPPWLSLELARRAIQGRLDQDDQLTARILDRVFGRPMPVPWVAGSCLLVRRSAFEQVGGFDERFFLYFEDIDFCLRLRSAGGQVWYDPTVTIVHERGQSARTTSAAAQRAYRASQLWYWEKHRGAWARWLVEQYQRFAVRTE